MREVPWLVVILLFIRVVSPQAFLNEIKDFKYSCAENVFEISITTKYPFSGNIYPVYMHDTPCAKSYHKAEPPVKYELTLTGCNTLSNKSENRVEYSNEIYIQMHKTLLTTNDETHKINCFYNGRGQIVLSSNQTTDDANSLPMALPLTSKFSCNIEVFQGSNNFGGQEAEVVTLGEKLTLLVRCDDLSDETMGMRVTDCFVSDGINFGEQQLYDENGCAIDYQLMEDLYYNQHLTRAYANFKAYKFPYSPSVYYRCNINLCSNKYDECRHAPPQCSHSRQSRQANRSTADSNSSWSSSNKTVQVTTSHSVDDSNSELHPVSERNDEICLDKIGFIIGISITAFLLLLAIVILIALLMWRRRRRIDKDGMSDTMSGYTANGYASSRGYS